MAIMTSLQKDHFYHDLNKLIFSKLSYCPKLSLEQIWTKQKNALVAPCDQTKLRYCYSKKNLNLTLFRPFWRRWPCTLLVNCVEPFLTHKNRHAFFQQKKQKPRARSTFLSFIFFLPSFHTKSVRVTKSQWQAIKISVKICAAE